MIDIYSPPPVPSHMLRQVKSRSDHRVMVRLDTPTTCQLHTLHTLHSGVCPLARHFGESPSIALVSGWCSRRLCIVCVNVSEGNTGVSKVFSLEVTHNNNDDIWSPPCGGTSLSVFLQWYVDVHILVVEWIACLVSILPALVLLHVSSSFYVCREHFTDI